MYLLDTNVWLERLLDHVHSDEVGDFLARIPTEHLFITDFALHSIGVILDRLDRRDVFLDFIGDLFEDNGVGLITLVPSDMPRLVEIIERFGLDFDDAYQYVAAEIHGLILVSFDADFDRTDQGRRTPREILQGL